MIAAPRGCKREYGAIWQGASREPKGGAGMKCPECSYPLRNKAGQELQGFFVTICPDCTSRVVSDVNGIRIADPIRVTEHHEESDRAGRIVRTSHSGCKACIGCGSILPMERLTDCILAKPRTMTRERVRFAIHGTRLVRETDVVKLELETTSGFACERCFTRYAGRLKTDPYRHTTDDNDIGYGAFNRGERIGRIVRSGQKGK